MSTVTDQAGSTADKLVAAARACLIEEGHAACTVKRIAALAGVNHGLVHHYFGSKDALLLEVLWREEVALRQGLAVTPERFVRDFAVPQVLGHPDRPRLFIEFLAIAKYNRAVAERLVELFRLRMEQLQEILVLHERTDGVVALATLFGLAMLQMVVPDLPAGEAARRMLALLRGAQAGEPGSARGADASNEDEAE